MDNGMDLMKFCEKGNIREQIWDYLVRRFFGLNDRIITPESIDAYSAYLTSVERSENTIMKYRRDVK